MDGRCDSTSARVTVGRRPGGQAANDLVGHVFRDPIGIGAPAIVGRVIAFGLVIAGTAFMPAPLRGHPEHAS
jgi:hypothetical protein